MESEIACTDLANRSNKDNSIETVVDNNVIRKTMDPLDTVNESEKNAHAESSKNEEINDDEGRNK